MQLQVCIEASSGQKQIQFQACQIITKDVHRNWEPATVQPAGNVALSLSFYTLCGSAVQANTGAGLCLTDKAGRLIKQSAMPPPRLLSPFRAGSLKLRSALPSDQSGEVPTSPLGEGMAERLRSDSSAVSSPSGGEVPPEVVPTVVRLRGGSDGADRDESAECAESHPAWGSPLETGQRAPARGQQMLDEVSAESPTMGLFVAHLHREGPFGKPQTLLLSSTFSYFLTAGKRNVILSTHAKRGRGRCCEQECWSAVS